MHLLSILLATIAPNAADIQATEEARIIQPLIQWMPSGKGIVEWAPDVETRNVSCTPAKRDIYDCTYESRVREPLENDFGPWSARHEWVGKRRNLWRIVART
jgi:hypothetical protein